MGYTIKVEHPHFPEGTIFNVGGLDRVPNGETLEIDEEMERLFIMQNGQTLEDAFSQDAIITLTGKSSLDPSVVSQLLPEKETPDEAPAWMAPADDETAGDSSQTKDEGGEE